MKLICYLIVFAMVGLILLFTYLICKDVELNEPMEILVARRINKLRIQRCKKVLKMKELQFYRNKNNAQSTDDKLKMLKYEMLYIDTNLKKLLEFIEN